MNEEWKKIPGFDFYEASDQGRIRSIDRIIRQKQPRYGEMTIQRNFKSKILSQSMLSDKGRYPYKMVTICQDKKKYKYLVHRLVLLTFIGECPVGLQCSHNDGNGLNNELTNLRWDTASNNQLDRKKHGTNNTPIMKGQTHPRSKFKDEDVLLIRNMNPDKNTITLLAKQYNVKRETINKILSRKSWRHL